MHLVKNKYHSNGSCLVAHRGLYKGQFPENTKSAWEAVAPIVGAIEGDVYQFPDGRLGMFHPQIKGFGLLKKPAQGIKTTRSLDLLTLEEATYKHGGTYYPVPTLEEFLEFGVEHSLELYLEPKIYVHDDPVRTATLIHNITAAVKKYGLTKQCHIIGFLCFPHRVQALHSFKDKGLSTSGIITSPLTNIAQAVKRTGIDEIVLGFDREEFPGKLIGNPFMFVNQDKLYHKIHRLTHKGIGVMTGFVNNARDLDWAQKIGIRRFSSDNVKLIQRLLQ